MKAYEPRVIVFLSCYNHEKYIGEALDSIIGQTYRNLEIYVVNDGSTDQSAAVIAPYQADERVHFFDLKENTGAVGAFRLLNQCVWDSQAKYIAGASSDDKWELTKIEKQVRFLEEHPGYAACFTWDKIIFEENSGTWSLDADYAKQQNQDPYAWFRQFFYQGNCLNAVSVMMNRSIYMQLGGYNWTYRQLQDFGLWLKLLGEHSFYILPEELTYYRRHDNNLSSNSVQTYIRHTNELYFIYRKILMSMPMEYFKRAFFVDFLYHNSSSDTEILAEMISLLLRQPTDMLRQLGFDLYMENDQNTELMNLLETKFALSASVFHKLTGSCGLMTSLFQQGDVFEQRYDYSVNQINLLLDCIDQQRLSAEVLDEFHQNVLLGILSISGSMSQGMKMFYMIRDLIWKIVDQKSDQKPDKKILVVLAEEECLDQADLEKLAQYPHQPVVVRIPKKDALFLREEGLEADLDPAEAQLSDFEKHRVKYFWELHGEPDIIYLKGLKKEEYPWMQMLMTCSLATKLVSLDERILAEEFPENPADLSNLMRLSYILHQ